MEFVGVTSGPKENAPPLRLSVAWRAPAIGAPFGGGGAAPPIKAVTTGASLTEPEVKSIGLPGGAPVKWAQCVNAGGFRHILVPIECGITIPSCLRGVRQARRVSPKFADHDRNAFADIRVFQLLEARIHALFFTPGGVACWVSGIMAGRASKIDRIAPRLIGVDD